MADSNVQNLRGTAAIAPVAISSAHRAPATASCLSIGGARVIAVVDDILMFERSHEGERLVIRASNLGADDRQLQTASFTGAMLLLSTHLDGKEPCRNRSCAGERRRRVSTGFAIPVSSGIAALEQIVQSSNAVPSISVGLQANAVLPVLASVAVIGGQKIDQITAIILQA